MSATIRVGGYSVSVADGDCASRPCFRFGLDKGSFTPGVGYTRYHAKPRPVCMTRHEHGCPHRDDVVDAKCGDCHKTIGRIPYRDDPLDSCPECGGENVYRLAVLIDPTPCCASPDLPRNPRARRQRCRSCGAVLVGWRLEHARATPQEGEAGSAARSDRPTVTVCYCGGGDVHEWMPHGGGMRILACPPEPSQKPKRKRPS